MTSYGGHCFNFLDNLPRLEVIMRLRSSAAAFVLMIPLLLGGTMKTDWEDWNHHGFNHPYHKAQIIVRLEAGETVDEICHFVFLINTRIWLLDCQLITKEEADRFCPEGLYTWPSATSAF